MEFSAHHAGTPDLFRTDAEGVRVLVRLSGIDHPVGWLRTEPDNEERLVPLTELCRRDGFVWLGAPLELDPASPVTLYAFKFLAHGAQRWLSERGIEKHVPDRAAHFKYRPDYSPAPWVWDQVFYQIFPDRFRDGDPANNVSDGAYAYGGRPVAAKPWGAPPDPARGASEFYGGDLDGIVDALDYLESLGATALYLNPIFESPSSHKYDTVDYGRVDPHFGGDAALVRLRRETQRRGMRLVLDAVINHTSERHPWFDRYHEHGGGAYGDAGSTTRGFYTFRDAADPESYVGWQGVRTLPVLDLGSKGVQHAVYAGEDAILRRWMRPPFAIDGWRLDVVHMLGEGPGAARNAEVVRAVRDAVRAENPQAYVLGECFFEAARWLQGDQLDGAMNYHGFTAPISAFLAGCDLRGHPAEADAADLDHLLTRARAALPFPIQLSQLNLLGSHDTPRFLTRLKGDRAAMRIAVTALFTYIGVPCVYYGDEIGMEGGGDPDCRRTFPWDPEAWDRDLWTLYRDLARVRASSDALRRGAVRTLHAHGDVFAFARVYDDEVAAVVLNRGPATGLTLPVHRLSALVRYADALTGERFHATDVGVTLPVAARSARVLVAAKGHAEGVLPSPP